MWYWARTGSHTCPPDRIPVPLLYTGLAYRFAYSRGERGEDVVGWALVVARPTPISLFELY